MIALSFLLHEDARLKPKGSSPSVERAEMARPGVGVGVNQTVGSVRKVAAVWVSCL